MLQRLRRAVGWSAPPKETPPSTRVYFQVYAKLNHGEHLYVVGDAGPLGNSIELIPTPQLTASGVSIQPNTSEGVRLVTTPELYPLWFNIEPVVLQEGMILKYRYAICSGGKLARFENCKYRDIEISGTETVIKDVFDVETSDDEELKHVIPRLQSTGEAFVDRPALNVASPDINTVRKRGSSKSPAYATQKSSEKNIETIARRTLSADSQGNESRGINIDMNSSKSVKESSQQRRSPIPSAFVHSPTKHIQTGLNVAMDSTDGVIIVAYRLPVLVHKNPVTKEYDIEWDDDNFLCPSGLLRRNNHPNSSGPGTSMDPVSEMLKHYNGGTFSSHGEIGLPVAMRLTWVGTLQTAVAIPEEDQELIAKKLARYHCVPVFIDLPAAEIYHKYCYGTLWRICHNVTDIYGSWLNLRLNPVNQKNAWSTYTNVNRLFVNKIIEVYNPGDLVWVQGFHLLVAPSFLTRRLPNVNVGLFLHTPFPSSEIFRTMPVREELLRGMLSASHVGFHLYEHARHFLACCRRILGLTFGPQQGGYITVDYNGRLVAVTITHIGIEPSYIRNVALVKEVIEETKTIEEKYGQRNKIEKPAIKPTGEVKQTEKIKDGHAETLEKRQIIVGIDKISIFKGVLFKLAAYEELLVQHPELVDTIHLIQIGVIHPTVESNVSNERRNLHGKVTSMVQRINRRFGHPPVVTYIEVPNTNLRYRVPLWNAADIFFNTSIRDAVNFHPFEFRYAKSVQGKPGVVIMSEFSGSSRVLTGSLCVNPWKKHEIVDSLYVAITMSQKEKLARHLKDLEYITSNTRTNWAERILVDLKKAGKCSIDSECMGYGLGLGYRMLEFNAGFKELSIEQVVRSYRSSGKRILLFDYGNTLVNEQPGTDFSKYLTCSRDSKSSNSPKRTTTNVNENVLYTGTVSADLLCSSSVTPPPQVVRLLQSLCSDPRNTVFVLSGKDMNELQYLLGNIKGLGLAAEHGYYYRWNDSNEWSCTKENYDDSWKDLTHSIMDVYTRRTHGTYIELKGSAILWQFRDADPEFGALQAKELHDQLKQLIEHFPVEILMGINYLEVRPEGIDKGIMVDRIVSTIERRNSLDMALEKTKKKEEEEESEEEIEEEQPANTEADFILCMGDDLSDEFMFSYLEEKQGSISTSTSPSEGAKQGIKKMSVGLASPTLTSMNNQRLFTVTVGKKPSAAKFYINSVDDTLELLHLLSKVSTSSNRNLSLNDLQTFGSSHRRSRPRLSNLSQIPDDESHKTDSKSSESNDTFDTSMTFRTARPHRKQASHSMMTLPTYQPAPITSSETSTFEQYVSSLEEEEETDGGIFF